MEWVHRTMVDGIERGWEVDQVAAARVAAWVARAPGRLSQEIAGMARYFPTWILAGQGGEGPARCPRCRLLAVPRGGAIRCVGCERAVPAEGLLWLGHLPIPAFPGEKFARRRELLRQAGFEEVRVEGGDYLLVPLLVRYPAEWPNVEPELRYSGAWLDTLALPRSGARYHLLLEGRACLFAWGQWQAMAVHELLQQRVVNHALSLIKIAAGIPPEEAFIGRIDHRPWEAAT